jgi:hypothetical protein
MSRIARKWDRKSLISTGRGVLIAAGGIIIPLLTSSVIKEINQAFHLSPELAMVSTAFFAIVINAWYQWNKGEPKGSVPEVSPEVKEIVQDLKDQVVEEVKEDSKKKK